MGLDTFQSDVRYGIERVSKGNIRNDDITVPTNVICFSGTTIASIACGESHAMAVVGDNRSMLWSWGMYKNAQLGLGVIDQKQNPRPIQTLVPSTIHRIACGGKHSMALIGDPSTVSTDSSLYFAGNDVLTNHWAIDIRPLNFNAKSSFVGGDRGHLAEDEVSEDGEEKIKNPFY